MIKKENEFKVKVEVPSKDSGIESEFVAEIWDATECYLPDFTPDWLYRVLESIEKSSGGECSELMESVFEIDSKFKDALKNHPRCIKYSEGGIWGEEEEEEDEDYE
jgi:hypothetical protein